jgi:pimeloyl-ACP methyl ester carboxylesterase
MHKRWKVMRSVSFLKIAVFCVCILSVAACGHIGPYLGFWQRQHAVKNTFQNEPTADLLRELEPENAYLLTGKFTLTSEYKGPILLVAVTDKFKKQEIVVTKIIQPPLDHYEIYLPGGFYDLYFFADINGNGYFDADEMVARPSVSSVNVERAFANDGSIVNGPAFVLDLTAPTKTELAIHVNVREQSYIYKSLDDEFFDPKYGPVGLYSPRVFTAHTQRYMFSLEALNPRKTIVLFVHGVEGTPRDFKYLVDGLDRTRYQPIFYFYPSGLPLQTLGSYLATIIKQTNENDNYQLERVIVVAHSMGGLVGLSALNELCREGTPRYLKGYVSFNSPYGGVDSASKGLQYAPAVVPAWRDVATGSPFLERLYKGNALKNIPLYLFFGYKAGESSDGTITLQSQLDDRIHLVAHKTYGFNATHVGVLNNEKVRQTFYRALSSIDEVR